VVTSRYQICTLVVTMNPRRESTAPPALPVPRTEKGRSFVYVLELRDGCYYVGKTENLERRIREHAEGYGSKWTKRHAFVRCKYHEEVDTVHSSGHETKITASEMLDKGVNRVRGAGLSLDREYTLADLELLVSHIGQALDLPYDKVRVLIKPELPPPPWSSEATPTDVHLQWECIYCQQSFRSAELLEQHTTEECLSRVWTTAVTMYQQLAHGCKLASTMYRRLWRLQGGVAGERALPSAAQRPRTDVGAVLSEVIDLTGE